VPVNSGVKTNRPNIINILLTTGGVVDINKILCCIIKLLMLLTSEYEPDVLIIVLTRAILPD